MLNNNENFTELTQEEWDHIRDTGMSSSEVVEYFYSGLKIRSFPDILRRFAPDIPDKRDSSQKSLTKDQKIKKLLIDKICDFDLSLDPCLDPERLRESVARNVRNWLSGTTAPVDRKTLIKICFALGLDEDKAQSFMKFTLESGFHLRDPEEAAFLYCLRSGKNYPDAVAFAKRYFSDGLRLLLGIASDAADRVVYTKVVAKDFASVENDEDFEQFYDKNLENFGRFYNTAYHKYFRPFIKELMAPGAPHGTAKDRKFSIEEVAKLLRKDIPLDKKTSGYKKIQKEIRELWPNETELTDMLNREKDVNRKILLLLYIETAGILDPYGDASENFGAVEGQTPKELLENHAVRINLMLDECGMARLDPRNPFDWLILYSLKADADEEGEGMAGQLGDVLAELFHPAENEEEGNAGEKKKIMGKCTE
jgi:hypothetical protein